MVLVGEGMVMKVGMGSERFLCQGTEATSWLQKEGDNRWTQGVGNETRRKVDYKKHTVFGGWQEDEELKTGLRGKKTGGQMWTEGHTTCVLLGSGEESMLK